MNISDFPRTILGAFIISCRKTFRARQRRSRNVPIPEDHSRHYDHTANPKGYRKAGGIDLQLLASGATANPAQRADFSIGSRTRLKVLSQERWTKLKLFAPVRRFLAVPSPWVSHNSEARKNLLARHGPASLPPSQSPRSRSRPGLRLALNFSDVTFIIDTPQPRNSLARLLSRVLEIRSLTPTSSRKIIPAFTACS